jgi:excisionase family DNA binding protein
MNGHLAFTFPPELVEQIAERVADILEQRQRPQSERRWLTVSEAAAYLGAKPQRVYDLRSSGRLGRHGDGGRALVDRRELDNLIEGGTA